MDLAALLDGHAPADLAWWLVGAFAAQLYRVRRRAVVAEQNSARWRHAAEARAARIDELIDENANERARSEALHDELVKLNTIFHTLRDR